MTPSWSFGGARSGTTPSGSSGPRSFSKNPIARGICGLLRIDLSALDEPLRQSDHAFGTIAASMAFTERGWAPSGLMTMPVYEGAVAVLAAGAVAVLAAGGTIEAAEEALVEGWNEHGTGPYLHHRVLGLGLGKDEEIARGTSSVAGS